MKGSSLSLVLNHQLTKINQQLGVLMEEKGNAAAVHQLMSECRNVTGDGKRLCDQRDELSQEVQVKIAVLLELILKVYRRCASASEFERDR